MRKCIKRVPTRNVLAAAMVLALFSTDVLSTILVTNGGDPDPNRTDTCSLRQALNLTANLSAAGNCVESDSSATIHKYIEMAPVLANSTITLEHGELFLYMSSPDFDNRLDMQMRGVTIDAHHASRVFHFKGHVIFLNFGPFALVRMTDVRITGGAATSADCTDSGCNAGGGIYSNNVSVALTRSTVSGNTASIGGGIAGYGNALDGGFSDWPGIYLYDSTLDGNVASFKGGGIFAHDLRFTTVRSTISNNSARMYGGGIATYKSPTTARHNVYGQTQLLESTVSGNQVSECVSLSGNYSVGAGIYAFNNPVIANGTTITGNHGGCAGAAIDVFTGPETRIDLRNSIISGNHTSDSYSTGPAEIANFFYGEGPTAANSCILGAALSSGGGRGVGNIYTDAPMLEPLANHGGTTATMRPLSSSPAIDHADDAACAGRLTFDGKLTDQRMVTQPQGPHCDIGSFEVRQGSFTIAASVAGSGRIDALPLPTGAGSSGGISNCTSAGGGACAATFVGENNDATLVLTPTPADGWHLATWTGDCIASATDATASLTIDAARSCNATFAIDMHTIGGFVQGLVGSGLVLELNGANALPIAADGRFIFPAPLVYNAAYSVTIASQPNGQTCAVTNASGLAVRDVNEISVICTAPPIAVGFSVAIDDGRTFALPGDTPSYAITVKNAGDNAVYGAALSTTTSPPSAFTSAWWSCSGACTPANGNSNVALKLDLPAHSQTTIHIDAIVAAHAPPTFNVAAHVELPPFYTDTSGTHDAIDVDQNPLIFRNGFEVPAASR
jgi:Divergent InlB B-repeat domain